SFKQPGSIPAKVWWKRELKREVSFGSCVPATNPGTSTHSTAVLPNLLFRKRVRSTFGGQCVPGKSRRPANCFHPVIARPRAATLFEATLPPARQIPVLGVRQASPAHND